MGANCLKKGPIIPVKGGGAVSHMYDLSSIVLNVTKLINKIAIV